MNSKKIVVSRESLVVRFRKQRRNPRPATRNTSRRGILLLVVLSLLTLFLMIGTAFIVTANQYRKMNKTRARITEQSQSPVRQQKLLDEVINQLVRDTNNQNSVLRFHSLLRDLYGNDGFTGQLSATAGCTFDTDGAGNVNVTNGQILELNFDPTAVITNHSGNIVTLKPTDNAYNGLVVTFLNGPARGQSTRIIGYNGTTGMFRVMSFPLANGSNVTAPDVLNGSKIVVNGRPFNGTGFGYSVSAPTSGAKLLTGETLDHSLAPNYLPIALMPNAAFFEPRNINSFDYLPFSSASGTTQEELWNSLTLTEKNTLTALNFPGLGGSDESYDAVDFQNMALGLLPMNPIEFVASGSPSLGNMVLPSFHRPALINYWWNNATNPVDLTDPANAQLLRKILLRPTWFDHPNFTGSNPEFANLAVGATQQKLEQMIYGPWDVDNDNDGIRDSVWIDFGAPVMKGPNGKMMKPMAALLVLDMDGRLNLNAHGTLDIANPTNFNESLAGGASSDILPQGQGSGTAEISLAPLMPPYDPSGTITRDEQRWKWYKRVFWGADAGNPRVPDMNSTNDFQNPAPDSLVEFVRRRSGKMGGSDNVPGKSGFDVAAQMKMQGVPRWATGTLRDASGLDVLGGYASTPDFYGRFAVGLNSFGQPVNEAMVDYQNNSTRLDEDSPYEVDLSLGAPRGESSTAADGPFSVAELERILRAYDTDAGELPSRIWELAGEFKQNSSDTTPDLARLNRWRTLLTTDSYDMPVPSVVVPEWMVKDGVNSSTPGDEYPLVMDRPAVGATFADLLEYRIRVGLGILNPAVLDPGDTANFDIAKLNQVRREMSKLLSPDLADGLRMDINRAIGNGRDDDNDGVVDEPGEDEGAFWVSSDDPNNSLASFKDSTTGSFRDDIDRDGDETITDLERGDTNGDGLVDSNDDLVLLHNLRRQMLARHLYVLAMTLVDPLVVPTGGVTDATYIKKNQQRARQLAQWAINVVDFRDPDNIMTAFEFDVNPFDGWVVDGNIGTNGDWVGIDGQPHTDDDLGGMVWGAERPELLITETLGWHDRRTVDSTNEDAVDGEQQGSVGSGKDTDFDQRHRPRGAAFIEFYCPLPENPAANADTHAKIGGVDEGINLAAVDQTGSSPVWRLMMYKDGGSDLDPDSFDIALRPKVPDRSVYFTDFDPAYPDKISHPGADTKYVDDGVAFFMSTTNLNLGPMVNGNPALPVRPGGYLVVGAGEKTTAGYLSTLGAEEGTTNESDRGIWLDATGGGNAVRLQDSNSAAIQDQAGFAVSVPANLASVAIVDQTMIGQSKTTPEPHRFTFSEPAGGYPDSIEGSGWDDTLKEYVPVLDIPLDDRRNQFLGGGIGGFAPAQTDLNDGETRLMLPANVQTKRTVPGFSWVYLQRLANPLLPWNPPVGETGHDSTRAVNPYMTVDSMGANVTVFNGLATSESRWPPGADKTNIANLQSYGNISAWNSFSSLQRGRFNDPTKRAENLQNMQQMGPSLQPIPPVAPAVGANLWNPEAVGAVSGAPVGYWTNRAGPNGDGKNATDIPHNFAGIPDCTLGFLNEPFRNGSNQHEPLSPFPWLTWNNRPFVNSGELLQVPTFRSSQLLQTFSFSDGTQQERYDGPIEELSTITPLKKDGPYGHLLNFFRADNTDGLGTPLSPDKSGIAGLYRVLDYLHVPSRFVGTETWLNPTAFGDTTTPVTNTDDPRYQRQPPFNRISSYREPGRVNLNTMANSGVYEGLMHGITNPATPSNGVHPGPVWNTLVNSRRGYSGGTPLTLDANIPTFFSNPFRSADAGEMVPLPTMTTAAGVNCTLLREETGAPLFAANTAVAMTDDYRNTDRNPYFRYQPMTRLSNLVTSRSNVYAVWVTIGFFEVEELDESQAADVAILTRYGTNAGTLADARTDPLFKRVYPDGYQLGEEVGNETGEIQRIREFALIDRTVPVAFEPGNNHNVEKAIRVRRRIE